MDEFNSTKKYKYNRRSIRLKNYDYSKVGYYFITICIHLVSQHCNTFSYHCVCFFVLKLALSSTGEFYLL